MRKKLVSSMLLLALGILLVAACAPGSDLEVTTPNSTIELFSPGPNPQLNEADAAGRVSGFVQGLWHGIIAPATLLVSFFNSDVRMYQVHNAGSEYDLGFLVGVALVISFISLLISMRR